ncbi:thermosome subunit beta [Picrophilus oshimae]|uniref:Thermosome subunit n=1 Tax=Picrophilus torridus (strain ATCC 700027 / DSM 9790 / JCM 10055 / NBRC 100828 / KAW 2/3) TaxID=1122961 RepID=A0A8G2L6R9_PICTO|nr:thermosome subunit beta [Picrophilus oshimae]SMD30372.1 thermosome subunit [Picrophilus oshimae DSM 9789]
MITGQTPILILKEGTERQQGKNAQKNNIEAAKAIADAVRTTLGPKGMDKMLVDSIGDIVITNDGATILKEMDIDHPTAKMLVEASKSQDTAVGDGTTTVVVLAGELLKQAESLLEQGVHSTVIASGYHLAVTEAKRQLDSLAIKADDEETLKRIAITALSGKNTSVAPEFLADLVIKAVNAVAEERDGKVIVDTANIKVDKKNGGSATDTQFISGLIIDKEKVHSKMPSVVKNAKIALINSALEIKKTEIEAKVQINDPSKIQEFLDQETDTFKEMVEKVKKSGANVLLCQKGIDDTAQYYLAKEGIYAVRRVKQSDMEKLAKATGAKIVTDLDDLTPDSLGTAEKVEERKIGDDRMTFITGAKNPKAVSILIRGGTEHVVDEIERALHDAIRVVAITKEDGKYLPGGGAIEAELSMKIRDYANSVGGREQLAIEAFAKALEIIPRTLAENAGMDPINTLIKLKAEHEKSNRNYGINLNENKIDDMVKLGVFDTYRVKQHALESAVEVASMILRIDDVIASKKSAPSNNQQPQGGMGGMGGGMPPY